MNISIVVAMSPNGIIGKDGKIPWHCKNELKLFKSITTGTAVVMGRKTWESLPVAPLPNRLNIILSNKAPRVNNGAQYATSILEAAKIAEQSGYNELMVIGGSTVYAQALMYANKLFVSVMKKDYEGDTEFPMLLEDIHKNFCLYRIINNKEFTHYHYATEYKDAKLL